MEFFNRNIRAVFYAAALLAVTLAAFFPCFSNGFIRVDDTALVYNNEKIFTLSWSQALGYFTAFHRQLYHPLVLLSYALEFRFFGMDPLVFHATNVFLHLANALLVFWIFRMLWADAAAAFLAALLFAVHPLRVESVAWVTERKDLLFAFFYLGALAAYLRYRLTGRAAWFAASLLVFLCSLLSKPMAVSLPFVLLLVDHLRSGPLTGRRVVEKTPFFVLALAFSVVAFLAQHAPGTKGALALADMGKNLLEANYNFMLYLHKTLLPINLSFSYPHYLENGVLVPGHRWYSPLATAAVVAAVLFSLRYTKTVLWGMAFYFITLLPAMNIVPFGWGTPGDRITYIPQLGLIFIAGSGLLALKRAKIFSGKAAWLLIGALCCLLAVLATLTYQRCGLWRNSYRLFTDVVRQFPDAPTSRLAYGILAEICHENGDPVRAQRYMAQALRVSGEAAGPSPLRAQSLAVAGDKARLAAEYEALLAGGRPYFVDVEAMKLYLELRRPDDTLRLGERSLAAGHEYTWIVRRLRGRAFEMKNEYAKALEEYTRALERNPRDQEARTLRGLLRKKLGDPARAEQDLAHAVRLYAQSPNITVGERGSLENAHDLLAGW